MRERLTRGNSEDQYQHLIEQLEEIESEEEYEDEEVSDVNAMIPQLESHEKAANGLKQEQNEFFEK